MYKRASDLSFMSFNLQCSMEVQSQSSLQKIPHIRCLLISSSPSRSVKVLRNFGILDSRNGDSQSPANQSQAFPFLKLIAVAGFFMSFYASLILFTNVSWLITSDTQPEPQQPWLRETGIEDAAVRIFLHGLAYINKI